MALLSLGLLLLAIFLGFFRHMNTGLLAIGFALVLGRLSGISDKEIINGFNYSLFMILLGVTYLFSLAQLNGSLELLAKKVVALAGKHTFMIPIVIYVFSVVLSALGPGTVPTMAIMMVFSMALELEMATAITMISNTAGISPLSTGGALALAAYSSAANASPQLQHRLFIRMFSISALGVVVLSILAYFGLYRLLL